MPNFDFSTIFSIAPMKFQQLSCAIVSKRENCIFQRFGIGKDGGIDGLFCSENERIVIQAKCTEAKGRKLISILRGEAEKANKINCSRYILVLSSNSVNSECKEKIKNMFANIQTSGDILTGQDINALLELPEYKEVERAYPELWLSSGNQLEEMLSESVLKQIRVKGASKFNLMKKVSPVFVTTDLFNEAIDILEQKQVVIISGTPGNGKTTHAVCLANYYLTVNEYKQLFFVNSVQEIEQIIGLSGQEKSVIVFDDFWGHSTFQDNRMELNFERNLSELFEMLEDYPNVRLIFTTREIVLQQGLKKFPEFQDLCGLDQVKIQLKRYSLSQKAEILYRYLDKAQLEYKYVQAIFNKIDNIIGCPAYTPRSVEYFLEKVNVESYWNELEYAQAFYEFVEYPEKKYEEIFKSISYGAKWICVLLFISEEEIRVKYELKNAFMEVADEVPDKIDKLEYENYLRELEGVFTAINDSGYGDMVIDFVNYSVRDFMEAYLSKHVEFYEKILAKKAVYYNHLFYLINNLKISEITQKVIIQRLMNEIDDLKFTYVYSMEVSSQYSVNATPSEYKNHKIWELIILYRKNHNKEIYHYIINFCESICEDLHSGCATYEVMQAAINIIPAMFKLGYHLNWEVFLQDYYQNIKSWEDLYFIDIFEKYCKDVYQELYKKNYKKIQNGLLEFLIMNIQNSDEEDDLDYLLMSAQDLFKKFNLPYDEETEKLLYEMAGRENPKKIKRSKTNIYKSTSQKDIDKMRYGQVKDNIKQYLLPDIDYLTPKQIKAIEHYQNKDYRKGYLTKGKFQEDNFRLVMDYLQTLPQLPKRVSDFYLGLTDFLSQGTSRDYIDALEYVARRLIEEEIFFFTERTLQPYLSSIEVRTFIDMFIENGIINKKGKWYHFWNEEYLKSLALKSVSKMNLKEKSIYYKQVFEEERLEQWIYNLKEKDTSVFIQVLVVPIISEYLEQIKYLDEKEKNIEILQNMSIQITLEDCFKTDEYIVVYYRSKWLYVMEILGYDIISEICDMLFEEPGMDLELIHYKFIEEFEDRKVISVNKLIESRIGRQILEEKGCIKKCERILHDMYQLCDSAETLNNS